VLLPSCQASFFCLLLPPPPLQTSSQKLSLASFFPSSWFNGLAFSRLYLLALLLSTRRIISGFNIFWPSLKQNFKKATNHVHICGFTWIVLYYRKSHYPPFSHCNNNLFQGNK
jgi:hypothetical protein